MSRHTTKVLSGALMTALMLSPVRAESPAPADEPPAVEVPSSPEPTLSPEPSAEVDTPKEKVHPLSPMAVTDRGQRLALPIELGGYFWVDTGYMARENAQAGQYDQDAYYMQGRFVLSAGFYRELGDLFATAKTELIGFVNEFTKSQFEAHVLDAYVQLGQRMWDIQVGRFLAWEVYHRGQGIELFTAEETGALGGPSLYWLQTTRGHKNEAGQAAIHVYPTDFLGFELAGVYGQEQNQNNLGLRPSVDLNYEGFRLMAGFEYFDQSPQTSADKVSLTQTGWAARLEYTLPETLRVGANVAMSSVEATRIDGLDDAEKSTDTLSVGGYVDVDFWRSSLGLGYHYTSQSNKQGEDTAHHQAFVSYLVRLPIDGLALKAVYGYALADIEDIDIGSSWENSMHSFRLRIAYDFK